MTPIFILTHKDWGAAIKDAAESIVGDMAEIYCFPLSPSDPFEGYIDDIIQAINEKNKPIIITDLIGGSTSNAAAILCKQFDIEGISGLDMELLIKADKYRQAMESKEVIDALLKHNTKHSIRQYYSKPEQ